MLWLCCSTGGPPKPRQSLRPSSRKRWAPRRPTHFISPGSKSGSINSSPIRRGRPATGSTPKTCSRTRSNGWRKCGNACLARRPQNEMSSALKIFWQRWLINAIAVMVAANLVKGIEYHTLSGLLVASLLLGIFNALLRPLLVLLSLPLVIFTLGLFTLVINALLLYFVGSLVKSFVVANFWAAFWGSLIISFVSLILNTLTGTGDSRIEFRRGKRRSGRGDGDGPVIDV